MNKSRLLSAVSVLLLSISISTTAVAVTIDFEGTGAPGLFVDTTPLTNLYAPLGVSFSGVDGAGGSILNQSGNFGINAHSGTDFLAFNTSATTGTIELLTFSSPIDSFEVYAAGGTSSATFLLEAFDSGNILLASDTITTTTWGLLSVASTGISTVKLTQTGASTSWVYDDITFNAVPIPPALWLFGPGLLGLVGIARRKKAA